MSTLRQHDKTNLKYFLDGNKKINFFSCKCPDKVINSVCKAFKTFAKDKNKLSSTRRKQLYRVQPVINKLIDKKVDIKEKRKLLVDVGVKKVLNPLTEFILSQYLDQN